MRFLNNHIIRSNKFTDNNKNYRIKSSLEIVILLTTALLIISEAATTTATIVGYPSLTPVLATPFALDDNSPQQQINNDTAATIGISGHAYANMSITARSNLDGDNDNTVIIIASSLYENAEYGIQIRYPDDWIYMEDENFYPFDFGVVFMSPRDAFEVGASVESGGTPEMPPAVGAAVMELPFSGNIDAQLLGEIVTSGLTSEGYEIISSNPNATLSGMPALEVVAEEMESGAIGMQVWTIQGGRAYAVLYLSDESRFDQSLPIAQDMISSFTIMDESSTTVTTTTPLTSNNNNNGNATATVQEEQQEQQPQQQAEWLPYDNPTYGVRFQINHQQSQQQQENEEEEEGQQNQGDSFSAIPRLIQTDLLYSS